MVIPIGKAAGRAAVFLSAENAQMKLYSARIPANVLTAMTVVAGLLSALMVMTVPANASQSIVALVNDEPISQYDIDQRSKLLVSNLPGVRKKLAARMKATFQSPRIQERWKAYITKARPKSKAEAVALQKKFVARVQREVRNSVIKSAMGAKSTRRRVLDALIEERLKLQEARKLNIGVSDEEVDAMLERMARRNKNPKTGKPLTRQQFETNLKKGMGFNLKDFRNRLKAQIAWPKVVRRKFGHLVHVGDKQIDKALAGQTEQGGGEKKAVLKLKKIRLAYASNADQKTRVQRLLEAEGLRLRFSDCAEAAKLLKAVPNAKIQNIGTKESDSLPQPLRGLVLGAKVGELTPPSLTSSGVELYAVCSRNLVLGNEKKRARVKSDLREKEFEIKSRRLLRDLRQDAYIEYR